MPRFQVFCSQGDLNTTTNSEGEAYALKNQHDSETDSRHVVKVYREVGIRAEARNMLKMEYMMQAARRASDLGGAAAGIDRPAISHSTKMVQREKNFMVRESNRDKLGLSALANQLSKLEEAQIETWDAVNKPPHEKAALCGKPVARILDNQSEDGPQPIATGFMVTNDLLLTNYHVFPDYDFAVDCLANFNYEYKGDVIDRGSLFQIDPAKFFYSCKELDFALVGVKGQSTDGKSITDQGFITMIATPGKIDINSEMNIIQYPLGLPKQYACVNNFVSEIFPDTGFVRYTTDTNRSSSGSPAFNKSWELSALHHCAIPKLIDGQIVNRNDQVWDGKDLDTVYWVSNEGVSISSIVTYLKSHQGEIRTSNPILLNVLLGNTVDPLLSNPVNGLADAANQNESGSTKSLVGSPVFNNCNFVFNGPVSITVYPPGSHQNGGPSLKSGEIPGEGTAGAGMQSSAMEQAAIRFDEDYDDRVDLGYDPDFLEDYTLNIPVVEEERSGEMYREDGEVMEFKYYNYSLAMNKKRRFCMWTAAMVNYDPDCRSGKSRKAFGRDTWRADPRLPTKYQVIATELYNPARRVEQGHIVRRDDTCWSADRDESFIEFANSDTFHFTNCTPQLEPFNRKNPRAKEGYEGIHGIWGALEEHIKEQLGNNDQKAVIFAGPHLDDKDPKQDFGKGVIQYPVQFWKIVCLRNAEGKLFTYGFWLSQKDVLEQFGLGLPEAVDFRKFKKSQVKISVIAKRTKLKFPDVVLDTDVLRLNAPESLEDELFYNEVKDIQIYPKIGG